jgi:6-pyruvoyl-tetrahydropterin synthase
MTVTIHNVCQDATGHTYMIEVSVNGVRIDQLVVKGHDRADGWPRLLEQIAAAKRERDAVEAYQRMIDWIAKDDK